MSTKRSKVKLALNQKSVDEKVSFGDAVVKAISSGPLAREGEVLIKSLKTSTSQMREARTNALAGEKESRSLFDVQRQKEDSFDDTINRVAAFVEDRAEGDPAVIEGAGFESYVPGGAAPVGRLHAPEAVNANNESEGAVILNWDPVKGARAYMIEYATDLNGENGWTSAGTSTRARLIIERLESARKYWFRVAAINSAGQSPWSEPAGKVVT